MSYNSLNLRREMDIDKAMRNIESVLNKSSDAQGNEIEIINIYRKEAWKA